MRIVVAVVLLLTSFAAVSEGPFGVEMGADSKSYPRCKETPDRPGQYVCTELPNAHANFEVYTITSVPSIGICGAGGMGRLIQDNGFGDQLRSAADEIAKQIELTYGPPTATANFIQPGSVWDGQNEWTMPVAKGERVYEFVWQSSAASSLPNNVKGIKLYVSGHGRDQGSVNVGFQFNNYSECLDAIRVMRSKAF